MVTCHRYPLVLAYDAAHFSALVLMDGESDNVTASTPDTGLRVEDINRRLQTNWPYAVIPITYANGYELAY